MSSQISPQSRPLVALVTGASSGIGRATARSLLAAGYTVYGAARRVERMRDLADAGAIVLPMDITVEADIAAVAERIQEDHGAPDLLVNNAGFGVYGAIEDTQIADARHQFEVNVFGPARLTQLLLPAMRTRGTGRIINLSSIGGKVSMPLGAWYHASKHALEGWSDSLRMELSDFGIKVILIEPGAIETEFMSVLSEPLMQRSGSGAYGPLAKALVRIAEGKPGKSAMGSPPELIAALILRAARARKPKTRYAAGRFAFSMLTARRWLSDRLFDRVLMHTIRREIARTDPRSD